MVLQKLCKEFILSEEFRELKSKLAAGEKASVEGIAPSSFPLIIASLFHDKPSPILVVTEGIQRMHEIHNDLSCFMNGDAISLRCYVCSDFKGRRSA